MTLEEIDAAVKAAERIAQPEIIHHISGEEIGSMRDYILATHALVRCAMEQQRMFDEFSVNDDIGEDGLLNARYDGSCRATNAAARKLREVPDAP